MAFLVILEREQSESRITALIHRRSSYIRYPYNWGFPGGSIDTPEKLAITNFPQLKDFVLRKVALREFIEETGGGYNSKSGPCRISIPGLAEANLVDTVYNDVFVPPGIIRIMNDESIVRCVQVPNNNTMIYFYLLDPNIDRDFMNNFWKPRALHKFRGEIDETYPKSGCHFGYLRVDINRLLFHPKRPVEESGMPLCPFLEKTFSSLSEKIAEIINILEMRTYGSITSSVSLPPPPVLPSSGTAILPGCYLRLRLEVFQEQHLNELTYRIQNAFPGEFVSQLEHAAELGCHPLHLTLCSQFGNVVPAISCERLLEDMLPAIAATWSVSTVELNFPDIPKPNLNHLEENMCYLVRVSKAGRVRNSILYKNVCVCYFFSYKYMVVEFKEEGNICISMYSM